MPILRHHKPLGKHSAEARDAKAVNYPDTSVLNRSLDMPPRVRTYAYVVMSIAAVLGIIIIAQVFDRAILAPMRENAAFEENLTRETTITLPILSELITMDDQEIMDTLTASGSQLFELTPIGENPNGGFEVVCLPETVTAVEAAAMYATGIDGLSDADTIRLLNGAWTLSVVRDSGVSMRLHYADFNSSSLDECLNNAVVAEGWQEAREDDNGVDDVGNTYRMGSITLGKTAYSWRVSVISLNRIYRINNLPETAYYVGIRLEG